MFFQHVYDKSLAQASYFIGCQKEKVALVIDPKRDVDTYLEIAEQNNMKITHIAETHIHADFLSGSRELAALTGAELYLSDEGGEGWLYEFPHVGLKGGDTFKVGNLKLDVLYTPGHTPESISFLLTDVPASNEPVMIFTGDFVFVGDVGRPDLLEEAAGIVGTKEVGAKDMFKSVNIFRELADFVQVWPGHGAGSACGKDLGAVPSTTVGYEKMRNWALQYEDDQPGFIKYLLEDQPEPPKYFAMMKKLNKVDRPLLTSVPKLEKLSTNDIKTSLKAGVKVIDTRLKADFAEGSIAGTINVQNNNSLSTWMGWLIDYDEEFILIADESSHDEVVRKLMRIGMDNIKGYYPGIDQWVKDGGTLEKSDIIDIDTFKNELASDNVQVVDIRGASEYKTGHVEGADNVFVGTIEKNLDKINRSGKVIIHCQSGDRSAIGYSLLRKHGYENVRNYSAGIEEWTNLGNPVVTRSEEAMGV